MCLDTQHPPYPLKPLGLQGRGGALLSPALPLQDLWIPYFTITTDITASAMRVYTDGERLVLGFPSCSPRRAWGTAPTRGRVAQWRGIEAPALGGRQAESLVAP